MHVNSHALPSVNSILLDVVSDHRILPPVTPHNTAPGLWRLRTLTIFSELFLSQLVEPSRQPASAAACRRFLEPDILEVSHLIMHGNSHALPSVNFILLQHPVLYLDGNHGLAGLCICLLIEFQPSSNVRQHRLV
jgi:hypothetical protein